MVRLQLIVDLVSDHRLLIPVMIYQLADDTLTQCPINGTVHAAVSTDSDGDPSSVCSNLNDLRIFLKCPQRRGAGWCTQKYLNPSVLKNGHCMVEPFKPEISLLRLQTAPCKLRHPDKLHTAFLHMVCILLPHLLRPLLRIIINPQ